MTMGRSAVKGPALLALYLCIGMWYPILVSGTSTVAIKSILAKGSLGAIATINCTTAPETANIEWQINGEPFKTDDRKKINYTESKTGEPDNDGNVLKIKTSTITITNVTAEDRGEYTCIATLKDERQENNTKLDLRFDGRLASVTRGPLHVNVSDSANFTAECVFEVYSLSEVKWFKKGEANVLPNPPSKKINATHYSSTYSKRIHNPDSDNGTYVCEMQDSVSGQAISGTVDVFVYDKPKVILDELIAINTSEVYMKWTLLNYNSRILNYFLFTKTKNDTGFVLNGPIRGGQTGMKNTSYVITNLLNNTEYDVKLEVKTDNGAESSAIKSVTTLATEPVFVPNISINGFSATSVTIGWAAPEKEIEQFIHYYILEARKVDEENMTRQAYHPRDNRNLPYMFDNLEPHSRYVFKVCACSDYGEQRCGRWSAVMEAATLDGLPSKPVNVTAHCGRHHMNLTWGAPNKPNAEIKGYTMEVRGHATFLDRHGEKKNATWGPLSKFLTSASRNVSFDDLLPNTLYTVQINAMTRTRRRGQEETVNCTTDPAPPDQPPRPRWRKILVNDEYRFKMYLPWIPERNGRICCYRVYMVRLRQAEPADWNNFPSPRELPVIEYRAAHGARPAFGAYITDVFSNKMGFPPKSEIELGDSETIFNRDDPTFKSEACRKCLEIPTRRHETTSTSTTTTTAVPLYDDDFATMDPEDNTVPPTAHPAVRRRRNTDKNYSLNDMMKNSSENKDLKLEDGPLDSTANYTLFVELILDIPDEPPMFSNYMNVLMPAATPLASQSAFGIEIALQVTCAVAALVLLLMIIFCIRQTRRSRKLPPHAHLELNPLEKALRYVSRWGGRPAMVPSAPPNMPPIAKDELAAAYAERQLDSDFGFQKEFELLQLLPECFPDRTTHASEARENQSKNRYPDIKAYDQTRVKLAQIDSITGSDYINANFVNGYKDRKRFICAQGPTDTTVNDFWRMIWEHGPELIVMLTNLEEYSKVKCSKYWPDEGRGARAFGNITVQHVAERRYSDYIVRELKITKQPTNSEGQPIVENNGVAKRNGDCKEPGDASVPTSPRELKDADTRIVKQYHFLMWKDFAAPEHAYSILKFIKRVNEAWSSPVVRPCVVHCSAGVGRTGTLVALDCLLEQLRGEGQAAVFNTIAELRRQRNFLVQSPKQYIFVYRALVEFAHYGDTEIPAGRLKSAIDRLRNTPPGGTACLMEQEFEKILNSPIPEPVKSCAAGAAEELRSKNRSQEILPYDRNRVILAPIPTRDFSTYINASFIEAYDNSESFVITQDPLPSTITDFWRMVSEHNVSTIVMLSELGDGKCPRYWDDGTATYEHISVQYEESESCPYYTRRQFRLVNNKCGTTQSVLALQYQGWPTAAGAVPEVTRGLAELADAAACHPCTMLAHCQLGTERSALFVALCILISQLRLERRVDVCTVARKVRSQRSSTIDTFSHYEFLHRAILNYAELHNLLEDS